ncbi:hypothetical protein BCR33DRAFT_846598 [Rhizoclosmatium globosum]|uniref:Uncharacterized protein n=1 Tax=Rhizoclosmatium globosum TaxID=329046 RepID=A0A1Y2CV42_9FUNG|nr:hypothetical protein HDU79_000601 [Rhizoclosmatium sp. JEL0117]ORY50929.1 hypothetical protein BCR33DRAFT_846598 [Rhizoclosmatium globosum]|eukprot:ORY50929.1 hypothetical protein BCR33DRAFT_846598 [Rhizoclosmatium globosum]
MVKKYKQPTHTRPTYDITHNQSPSSKDNLATEALPKSLKLVLAKSAKIQKKKTDGSKPKRDNETTKIQAGESIRAFTRRIESDMRNKVNAAAKAETATAQKRKRRLAERKLKRKEKGKKKVDSDDEKEKEFMTPEAVPFGFQAQEPPRLTVVPKKVGGGAGALRAVQAAMEAKERKEKDAERKARMEAKDKERDAGLPAVGRKVKLKDLPLVKQKNLMEERQRVIDEYRKNKAAGKNGAS